MKIQKWKSKARLPMFDPRILATYFYVRSRIDKIQGTWGREGQKLFFRIYIISI